MLEELYNIAKKELAKNDPAHDFAHILRVLKNAKMIAKKERVDLRLVTASVLLHDIISYKKSDPRSANASIESSEKARKILLKNKFSQEDIDVIADAIRDHSYSRGATPRTIIGKILQDADRIDALGAIGIARTFAVGGAENRTFYNSTDPFCEKRTPDDKKWTLDHFYRKLLNLEKTMNTKTGKLYAQKRIKIMKKFLEELQKEI